MPMITYETYLSTDHQNERYLLAATVSKFQSVESDDADDQCMIEPKSKKTQGFHTLRAAAVANDKI